MSSVIAEFRAELERAGLLPDTVIADGELHRCPTAQHPRSKHGWYIYYGDHPINGLFGDWAGSSYKWKPDGTATYTAEDYRIIEERKQQRKFRLAERHKKAAEKAAKIWQYAKPAKEDHSYLKRKRVGVHGIRQIGKILFIPVFSADDNITSIQRIYQDGRKRFLTGGQVKGCSYLIGEDVISEAVVAEGFATAASIHEATGYPVFVAFSASNLINIARTVRQNNDHIKLIVAADIDKNDTGLKAAIAAANATEALVAVPK